MKFGGIDSIEQILRAFVEETHRREKEDRELCIYLKDWVPTPYPPTHPKGLAEVWEYLRWSITSSGAIDRSCFDEPSDDDSYPQPDPRPDDNYDNIPF